LVLELPLIFVGKWSCCIIRREYAIAVGLNLVYAKKLLFYLLFFVQAFSIQRNDGYSKIKKVLFYF